MMDASPHQESLADQRSTEDLVRIALTLDTENHDYWDLVWILQTRLATIFKRVEELAVCEQSNVRDLAANVLGDNVQREKTCAQQCVRLLTSMLVREGCPNVQASIIRAIGHHHQPSCLPLLLHFEGNQDADVRYALTQALGAMQEEAALDALCRLSFDEDRDIRNWATFGIGSLTEKKSVQIHDALVARLSDEDDEVRGEALVGLAERCEVCAAPAFLKELSRHSPEILRDWLLIKDAAAAVERCNSKESNPEWQSVLKRLKELGISGEA